MGRLSDEQLAAWVIASCQAQGVPVKVTEARVVEHVRALLTGQAGRTAPARQRGRSAPAGQSQPPDRGMHAVGVEGLRTTDARPDNDVVHKGSDDRGLPRQVQSGPRSA